MNIEILTIGDEILSGNVIDTNTAYLSDKLWLAGFEVTYHSGVRDDEEKISEVLLLAASRSQIVIVTGGLGPTADDFTLEVAAKAFKKKLVCDKNYLRYLQNLFKQWGRPLAKNNEKQAYVPEGAKTFQNRVGTAPGVCVTHKKTQFYFLPGVPREMKQLFEDFVLPDILLQRKDKICFTSKMLKCFGAAESELDTALSDLYVHRLNIENARIGFRAHFPDTFIKISAWSKKPDEAKKVLLSVEKKIRDRIGKFIYGEGEDTLESVVGELLTKRKKTVAIAESCTGGLVSHRLTNISGSSNYLIGTVVSYSNESKIKLLGVPPGVLQRYGAVSSQCALEMAKGVQKQMGSYFGLAITGIAGPTGGTTDKPVGTVHVALASSTETKEKKQVIPRNREWFKLLASSMALEMLRRALLL